MYLKPSGGRAQRERLFQVDSSVIKWGERTIEVHHFSIPLEGLLLILFV